MGSPRALALLVSLGCFSSSAWGQEPEPPKAAGTDVPTPARRKHVEPAYPQEALREGVSGIVIVELTIDERGNVVAAELVRSIPELDQAALDAVRQWKYAVTRVDGRPVRVRHVVPISFTLRVPEVRRQKGIPELRRGVAPTPPRVSAAPPAVSAIAEVTLAPDGSIASIDLLEGQRPWSDALLSALRTWRFTPAQSEVTLSFRVEALFQGSGSAARVTLNLTGLRELTTPLATPSATPAAVASEPAPLPTATPDVNVASAATAPPAAAAAAGPSPSPTPGDISSIVQPESDVINVAQPVPTPEPTLPPGPGTSAVAGVILEPGVPDLLQGRRPVVPPFARIHEVSGIVTVHFAVDGTGRTSVQQVEGPEELREQAHQAVRSWVLRARLPAERLFLIATFTYSRDEASARVRLRD